MPKGHFRTSPAVQEQRTASKVGRLEGCLPFIFLLQFHLPFSNWTMKGDTARWSTHLSLCSLLQLCLVLLLPSPRTSTVQNCARHWSQVKCRQREKKKNTHLDIYYIRELNCVLFTSTPSSALTASSRSTVAERLSCTGSCWGHAGVGPIILFARSQSLASSCWSAKRNMGQSSVLLAAMCRFLFPCKQGIKKNKKQIP